MTGSANIILVMAQASMHYAQTSLHLDHSSGKSLGVYTRVIKCR